MTNVRNLNLHLVFIEDYWVTVSFLHFLWPFSFASGKFKFHTGLWLYFMMMMIYTMRLYGCCICSWYLSVDCALWDLLAWLFTFVDVVGFLWRLVWGAQQVWRDWKLEHLRQFGWPHGKFPWLAHVVFYWHFHPSYFFDHINNHTLYFDRLAMFMFSSERKSMLQMQWKIWLEDFMLVLDYILLFIIIFLVVGQHLICFLCYRTLIWIIP